MSIPGNYQEHSEQDSVQSPPTKWPYNRPPTVDDLRFRECWICREEETFTSRRQRPRTRWVHPCKCTLVAHESCLLEWISRSQPSLDPPPKCPQCDTPFQITSRMPRLLRALDWADGKVGFLVKWGCVGAVGGAVLVLCTVYGVHALRCFVGKDMTRHMLGDSPSEWPFEAWVNLPLIPGALFVAQTSRLDHVLLFMPLVLAPFFHAADAGEELLSDGPLIHFPPTPQLTLVLFPIVKVIYSTVRRGIVDWAMSRHQPRHSNRGGGFRVENRGANGVVGAGIGAGAPDNMPADPMNVIDVHINATTMGRFVSSALLLPAISRICGDALLCLSRFSKTLRSILGLETYRFGGPGVFRLQRPTLGSLGLRATWEGLDPIWWRNAIGVCLFIVSKDAISLLHAWLRKDERSTRKILSRNFEGVDLEGLDLLIV